MLHAEWSVLKVLWEQREKIPDLFGEIVWEDFLKEMTLVWVLKNE